METNQVANHEQAPNVGWFRGQELPLKLGLVTFLCLAVAIIGGFRPFLGLFALSGAIALILEKLAELIYHGVKCLLEALPRGFYGVCQFLMSKIIIFVVLWYIVFSFLLQLHCNVSL